MLKLIFDTANDYQRVHAELEKALTASDWDMFTTEPSGSGQVVTANLEVAQKIYNVAKRLHIEVTPQSLARDEPTRAQLIADTLALLKAPAAPRTGPKSPLSTGEGLAILGIALGAVIIQVAIIALTYGYFSHNPLSAKDSASLNATFSGWDGLGLIIGLGIIYFSPLLAGLSLIKKILSRDKD